MSYMQDPNMEEARLKIIGILKEHDLMGSVIFAGKERSGFFNELSPSWSCAKIEDTPEGVAVRIKSKREDYESSDQQLKHVTATVNGLMGLMEVHKFTGQMITGVVQMIGQKMHIRSVSTDFRIQKAKPSKD